MSTVRAYNSPLRDQKAQETREAILLALYDLMSAENMPDEISIDAVSQKAGIQRRTVFRHFPTKSDLLTAFWPWLNARMGTVAEPQTLAELLDGPKVAFPKFDAHENAIRAALHSRTGRELRMGSVPSRRATFGAALAPAIASCSPDDARKAEAIAHLLYSAPAWEVLKDYGGLTGDEAGETASWALKVILSAITSGSHSADATSPATEKRDER